MSGLRKAKRQQAKIRLGLASPSGGGKTYSALLIAKGLVGDWSKVAIIDTENGSADLYEHLGDYLVYSLDVPYSPDRYIKAIKECEEAGVECIIIDSITHEWSGAGGCLDIHEAAAAKQKIKNTFTAWKEVTPLHQKFIDTILQSKCHIITTVRNKTEYLQTNNNGRNIIQKVGMQQVTRDGFEYELTIALDLDASHFAITSKDRTGLFEGQKPFIPSEETGRIIKAWCNGGIDLKAELLKKIDTCTKAEEVNALAETYTSLKVTASDGTKVYPDDIRQKMRAKFDELNTK